MRLSRYMNELIILGSVVYSCGYDFSSVQASSTQHEFGFLAALYGFLQNSKLLDAGRDLQILQIGGNFEVKKSICCGVHYMQGVWNSSVLGWVSSVRIAKKKCLSSKVSVLSICSHLLQGLEILVCHPWIYC